VAAAGIAGWAVLQPDWAPDRPTLACDAIFATGPTVHAPDVPDGRFVVQAELLPDRPDAVLQHQIVDANGFGWVTRDLRAGAPTAYRTELPPVPRTHTIRVGVLTPDEEARARATREAARAFDLRAWRAVQGCVAPAVTLCETASVAAP